MRENLFSLLDQDSLRTLKQQLRAKGVIPFVGAGLSVPFGFMAWTSFLKSVAGEYGQINQIEHMLCSSQYEEAAELLNQFSGFVERVQDCFGHAPRRVGEPCSVEWLPKLFPEGPVFTTNYDHVLENVFANSGRPFSDILHTAGGREISRVLELREHILIKLHGDFSSKKYRVLTLDDYRTHYGFADQGANSDQLYLPQALRHLFTTESVLFLGCSLSGDRYLQIMKAARPFTTHYAVIEDSINPVRDHFFASCNIRPIQYMANNGHQGLYDILAYLCGNITEPAQADIVIQIDPPTDLLSEVHRYFERNPTGLPPLSKTLFFNAFRFRNDDATAQLIIDAGFTLKAVPSLHILGTHMKRDLIDLRDPAEGNVDFDFLKFRVSVLSGKAPSVTLYDSTYHLSIRFEIRTRIIE
ncbi:MAG TPA: SIR2 family protein [Pyrinomonadaceae bacterium]|nr:SIR2 family protein [Pyrinomonadaceae bacterium]